MDYWDRVSVIVHPSLEAFLEVSAPAGRWFFSTRGTVRYADAPFAFGDVLIFGKETRGLPDELLARFSDRVLRLPMRARSVRSLNLSTAVGIAAYRALERLGFPDLH